MQKNRQIALRGALMALAMVLSYMESFIPLVIAVPGVKIGLANIVTLIALYKLGMKDALIISIGRILLSGILFGNLTVIIYSLAGAAFSLAAMKLGMGIKRLSVTGISILGGVFHNLGQVLAAAFLLQNGNILYYLAVLFIAGTIAGTGTGILTGVLLLKIDFPAAHNQSADKK